MTSPERPSARPGPAPAGPAEAGIMQPGDHRTEHDSMGEVRCRPGRKWQAQTQRAVENFPVSAQGIERSLIRGLALVKRAAAMENAAPGRGPGTTSPPPSAKPPSKWRTADWDAEFPIDVFQTGSGTSSNMNMNEVLATLRLRTPGPARYTPMTR